MKTAIKALCLWLALASLPCLAQNWNNFGSTSWPLTSTTAIPATAGQIRLANGDKIESRNNGNSANLSFWGNTSDQWFMDTPLSVAPTSTSTDGLIINLPTGSTSKAARFQLNSTDLCTIDYTGALACGANTAGGTVAIGTTSSTNASALVVHGGNTTAKPGYVGLFNNADATGAYLQACSTNTDVGIVSGAAAPTADCVVKLTKNVGTGNVTTAGTIINTGTCQAQTGITITGTAVTDKVVANIGAALPATWQTGIQLSAHPTAVNTVTVYLCNPTAGNITPAATQVNVEVIR